MTYPRLADALEAFRKWEGWIDEEHPDDPLRVPLEMAIEAYNQEAE